MGQDILRIEAVEVIGTSLYAVSSSQHSEELQLSITAIVDDMVQTAAAVIYPPDIAEPAQFGPARCLADITVCLDDVQWEIAE